MIQPRRLVPRERDLALSVTVESVDVAEDVEVKVVGIPQPVGDDLALGHVGGEPHQRASAGGLDRGVGEGVVLLVDTRSVATDQVPPAVGALVDRMGIVFASTVQLDERLRRAVGHVVAIGIGVAQESAVSQADQVATVEEHSLGPRLRLRGVLLERFRFAIVIGIDQDADIPSS